MNKKGTILAVVLSVFITFLICSVTFILYFNNYIKSIQIETPKTEIIEKTISEVQITDSGISDAVSKVYDAVGVIQNYRNNKLYATGSGFVFKIDTDKAYILTNHHVIEKATEVYFVSTDKEKIKAEIVGSDEYADIAVLSIDATKVNKIAEIGNSKDLRIGDTLFTVGAPVDSDIYFQSVTRGVLSGKDRLIEIETTNKNTIIMQVLQTDAAINSGNSGGPLCNSNGEVIGINSSKLQSSNIEGMGFAIPIETALEYANKFINKEEIIRPHLGVSTYNPYSNIEGTYIYNVEPNSIAANAGLQKGDIITKINDVEVSSSAYLKYELYKYKVGDTIKITYERNSIESTIDVTL